MITCGTINGGYGYNIIADHVQITGTTRSFTKETQEMIKARMGCICCGVAQTYGGEIDMEYECKFFGSARYLSIECRNISRRLPFFNNCIVTLIFFPFHFLLQTAFPPRSTLILSARRWCVRLLPRLSAQRGPVLPRRPWVRRTLVSSCRSAPVRIDVS